MADVAEKMEKMQLQPGEVIEFKPKMANGKRGEAITIKSNLSKIDLKPDLPYFKYDVAITATIMKNDGATIAKEVTRPSRQDTTGQSRKGAAVAVYKEVLRTSGNFFEKTTTIYDRAKVLFALKDLKAEEPKTFTVKLTNILGFEDAVSFEFTIKKCADSFQCTTNDVHRTVNARPALQDKTVLEALNLICSQKAFMDPENFVSYGQGTHFLVDPYKYGFKEYDLPALPDGKYMGVAICKKVAVLEGDAAAKKPTAYLSTEIKKTSFHTDYQNLADKICEYKIVKGTNVRDLNMAYKQFKTLLRGIVVCPVYNRKTFFPIHSVTERTAGSTKFQLEKGGSISVAEYFRKEKGLPLKYPDLFMVVIMQRNRECYYPLEVLEVGPSQRVVTAQATPAENETAIKASATLPQVRLGQTERMKKALDFTPTNNILLAAGVKIAADLATAPARILPGPNLQFGKNSVTKPMENCKWKSAAPYMFPAKLTKWQIVSNIAGYDKGVDPKVYAVKIVDYMKSRGMQVTPPQVISLPSPAGLETIFSTAANQGVELLMFVSSDSSKIHDDIKALELKHQILTQEVRTANVKKIVTTGAIQTLENIVNKTNIKLGGFNFQANLGTDVSTQKWLMDPARLFFGFELSHPAALSKAEEARGLGYRHPSVLGYACNSGRHPQAFYGDYLYVEPRSTAPMGEKIAEIVPKCLKDTRANRGATPSHLVFFFHGVSEGQYGEIATTYLASLRKGVRTLSETYKPTITLIAVTKQHNERFYTQPIKGEKAAQQNVVPGTIVDSVLVNPCINEFYLNSHSAFQGTAKSPKYTVIYDDSGAPMDFFQGVSHGLCFLHQIVNMSVSVPAPLIVADRCAKRGSKNFAVGNSSGATAAMDFQKLNSDFTNDGKKLGKVRYNA